MRGLILPGEIDRLRFRSYLVPYLELYRMLIEALGVL